MRWYEKKEQLWLKEHRQPEFGQLLKDRVINIVISHDLSGNDYETRQMLGIPDPLQPLPRFNALLAHRNSCY